jgi:hypothetical protein
MLRHGTVIRLPIEFAAMTHARRPGLARGCEIIEMSRDDARAAGSQIL